MLLLFACSFIYACATEEQKQQFEEKLIEIFKKIDVDGSGDISLAEAIEGVKEFSSGHGHTPTDEKITEHFNKVEKNKDGKISFAEFKNLVFSLRPHGHFEEKLIQIFKKIDVDGSGDISLAETIEGVKEFGSKHGHTLSDEKITEHFDKAEKNENGKVNYAEFKKLVISLKHAHFEEKIIQIFKKLDKDDSGSIDLAEAIAGAKEFGAAHGHAPTDDKIKEHFLKADKNGDGKIDYDEFKNVVFSLKHQRHSHEPHEDHTHESHEHHTHESHEHHTHESHEHHTHESHEHHTHKHEYGEKK